MSIPDGNLQRLGKQIREYRTRTVGQFLRDEASDLGLLAVVCLLLLVFTQDNKVYRPIAYLLSGIIGLIFLFHGLMWLVRTEKVQVFEHGLRRIAHGKQHDLAWSHVVDVESSFVNRHHRTGVTKEYLLRIYASGERTFEFTHQYPDVLELANLVQQKLAERDAD
jgi:hypothetical protein